MDQTGETAETVAISIEIDKSKLEPLTKPSLAGHQWVQIGPDLVCQSCPIRHGVRIGTDKHLIGISESGLPILKRVSEE